MGAPNLARISPDRTVREECKLLTRLGWTYQGTTGAGHLEWAHPQYGDITISCTPRNPGMWKRVHRRAVARRMGMSLWEFERRIAGQPTTKRPRTQRRRKPRSSRPVSLTLVEQAPARPVVESVGSTRAWFFRCHDCAMPWHRDARTPDSECPRCGSRRIAINPPREAAA